MANKYMIEIDWAEDRLGRDILGPIGPFESHDEANAWMTARCYNGEWGVVVLRSPESVEEA